MWFKAWHRKQKSIKKSLAGSHLHRIWGRKLFSEVLWKIDRDAIAGGLALGLFVAFTPTIGFQMLLVACGALYFKVNLPIALAACWVTNPLTALPIYTAAWKLGKYTIQTLLPVDDIMEAYNMDTKSARVLLQGIYIWTGSFFFSMVSAVVSNVAVKLLWKTEKQPPGTEQTEK
ncbi:MAG: DUF2062 domain-containing protein [Sedimentisphaerales bacterium]|nr:DUF2062 domain-containing protein [Sedimentisphaerales bacterium]